MRKYVEVWESLKEEKFLRISLDKKFHSTTALGVRKESLRDQEYRKKCVANGHAYIIDSYSISDTLYLKMTETSVIPSNFVKKNVRIQDL